LLAVGVNDGHDANDDDDKDLFWPLTMVTVTMTMMTTMKMIKRLDGRWR
jgi:hypothetical protein